MAEAWTRRLHPGLFEAYSAGTNPGRLDPRAVRVMAEAGIDMSAHRSKHLDELASVPMNCVIRFATARRRPVPCSPEARGTFTRASMTLAGSPPD
jgi:arsenate reductase (thioredoxin)